MLSRLFDNERRALMSIGYACLTMGVPNTSQKSCMLKNASEENLSKIIDWNLNSFENIIDYNIKNNIKLFRISSDLIPFGSSTANALPWWNIFRNDFLRLSEKIKNSGMRVSMHPGQYTVLNSPSEEVVSRAIEDLNYHAKVLDSLCKGAQHKIILHIGGIYKDKEQAIDRFIKNYERLDSRVKRRLVVENDDRSYNISDVLEIGGILNIPVIFDDLHHQINPPDSKRDEVFWIGECRETWKEEDGKQKIHYSQQNPNKRIGSHSESIRINEFMDFFNRLDTKVLDIMLEVKDKNLSALKCINCTSGAKNIKVLEEEWSRYKYSVLESSPANYLAIRKLLINKKEYPAIAFYNLVELALDEKIIPGNSINAAQHVWGYFKDVATEREKVIFLRSIDDFREGKASITTIKNKLCKMAITYNREYLINSYYFVL